MNLNQTALKVLFLVKPAVIVFVVVVVVAVVVAVVVVVAGLKSGLERNYDQFEFGALNF